MSYWPHRVLAIAIAATVAGSLLPWASIFGVRVYGVETSDGKLVLIVSLVAGALLALKIRQHPTPARRHWHDFAILALGILVAITAGVDMSSFAAGGLWVTLVASIAWAAMSAWIAITPTTLAERVGG